MENKNFTKTKERIIKSCKALRLVIRILICIVVISLLFAVIGVTLSITSTEENTNNEITNNSITEENNAETEFDGKMFIEVLFTLASILCIDKLLKETIEKETPFTETNVKAMKALGTLALAISILKSGRGYIGAMSFIIISRIFEYGYLLQTESDETL